MDTTERITALRSALESLYARNKESMLFHGWHHVTFVAKKAKEFAELIDADSFLAESAGLVHDLNYLVEINSEPGVGAGMRSQLLAESGYSAGEIERIENIVLEEHTATRGAIISAEGMALSDADTLFKALPITPILFASKYIEENQVDITKLANKVVSEQQPLMDQGIYFYTQRAKEKYMTWAQTNLVMWRNVVDCLQDGDVQEMLATAKEQGAI